MSSFDRVKADKNGRIFIPMNVEGGVDDGFFTPLKMVTAICMLLVVIYEAMLISDGALKPVGVFMYLLVTSIIFFYLFRYVMFEERYYYKMYKKMQYYKNPTPAVFWDIVDVHDTDDGSIIIYSDIKLGVIIKLERDTIIGRDEEFKQAHYDALAEYFKEINLRELQYVYLNIMEHADKDPRLHVLDDVVMHTKNTNVAKILEMHTGYLKTMARRTLYESEYYLIYTPHSNKLDSLINDVYECGSKLMDGAYAGFEILKKEEIHELAMTSFGVRYFDQKAATLAVFNRSGAVIKPTFQLQELYFEGGEVVKVGDKENMILNKVTSMKKRGKIKKGELSLRDAFSGSGIYKLSEESNVYKKPVETDVNIKNASSDREVEVHTVEWDESISNDDLFFNDTENTTVEEELGLSNEIEDASKVAKDMKVKKQSKLAGIFKRKK